MKRWLAKRKDRGCDNIMMVEMRYTCQDGQRLSHSFHTHTPRHGHSKTAASQSKHHTKSVHLTGTIREKCGQNNVTSQSVGQLQALFNAAHTQIAACWFCTSGATAPPTISRVRRIHLYTLFTARDHRVLHSIMPHTKNLHQHLPRLLQP